MTGTELIALAACFGLGIWFGWFMRGAREIDLEISEVEYRLAEFDGNVGINRDWQRS